MSEAWRVNNRVLAVLSEARRAVSRLAQASSPLVAPPHLSWRVAYCVATGMSYVWLHVCLLVSAPGTIHLPSPPLSSPQRTYRVYLRLSNHEGLQGLPHYKSSVCAVIACFQARRALSVPVV